MKVIKLQIQMPQETIPSREASGAVKELAVDFSQTYPLNILLAEDNPVNQKLAERILLKLGYKPEIVSNGHEVLRLIMRKDFELILMDIQMPEMDGLDATRNIRMRPGHQPVIIAITADSIQADRSICLEAGMDDYISKPIKIEELVSMLAKWSEHSKEQRKAS
jgi:CheY-like chemotaxis protein